MTNYWKDLKVPQAWGKIERFNYIINYINYVLGETDSIEDTDYWCKLSLREQWNKGKRFNFIMNYIDEKLEKE